MSECDGASNDDGATFDLRTLIGTEDRDFLVRSNGDQVKIRELDDKVVGFFFSASWCGPCEWFKPGLTKAYHELTLLNANFEIVYVPNEMNDAYFNYYFSGMPWLAIPFADSDVYVNLYENLIKVILVKGVPGLTFLDADRRVVTGDGVGLVTDYGTDGFPYTAERIQQVKEEKEAARQNPTLRNQLFSSARDFVLSNDGTKATA